jgi:hypothetical protein
MQELKLGPNPKIRSYIYNMEDIPGRDDMKFVRISQGLAGKSKCPRLALFWLNPAPVTYPPSTPPKPEWQERARVTRSRKWNEPISKIEGWHHPMKGVSRCFRLELEDNLEAAEAAFRRLAPALVEEMVR